MELKTAQEKKAFSEKNTYTAEEKRYIMDRLNAERRIQQKKAEISKRYTEFTEEEKKNILKELNEKRLEAQMYDEIKRKRTAKKKIYRFDVRAFYKVLDMGREYYLLVEDMEKLGARPQIITLYFKVFGEMKKKDFLMQTKNYSDKVFISDDMLKVHFMAYKLEDA